MRWFAFCIIGMLVLAAHPSSALTVLSGNITVSEVHEPRYIDSFTRIWLKNASQYNALNGYRPANLSINYTKVQKIDLGTRPKLQRPDDLSHDVVRKFGGSNLDPRTCPNDFAFCYQLVENNVSLAPRPTTSGANYSALSLYRLPPLRVRTFVCVGEDTDCVKSATNCFCPSKELPSPPTLKNQQTRCDEETNLCLSTYASFTLCKGNLSACQQKYNLCSCGKRSTCYSMRNACVNERNELKVCQGEIGDCLARYKSCFCGSEVMGIQSCTTPAHRCERKNLTYTCYGTLEACALQADKCEC